MVQTDRLAAEAIRDGVKAGLKAKGIETYEPVESAQDLIDEC